MKRKIAAVTSSRADFSHLYWPLREPAAHPEIDLRIVASARTLEALLPAVSALVCP